ncbi:MAG: hypothetical protein LBE17_14940 [Treponema sp.]|nr:hypothetical protein [Treponema sp.]
MTRRHATVDSLLQLLVFILTGLVLLWLGATLFFRIGNQEAGNGGGSRKRPCKARCEESKTGARQEGGAGSPRCCPVCGLFLPQGELVKSSAFPDPGNGQGRLMHIEGCIYCLEGRRTGKRKCPVCGAPLNSDEFLFARMFNKSGHPHVHVLGCSRCRGPRGPLLAPSGAPPPDPCRGVRGALPGPGGALPRTPPVPGSAPRSAGISPELRGISPYAFT